MQVWNSNGQEFFLTFSVMQVWNNNGRVHCKKDDALALASSPTVAIESSVLPKVGTAT